ncbi:CoA ester lyase [Elioraea sp. Yellowstone]|jgi:citrate lyase subunit beta/citryl-CoA lyase|uniref:HpcH/HpaI aldolase/citrate lyase family protein n=1 Tax=Elioraea sp. Yellowstone TaxID=2592070 RepID=UPI00114EC5BF|nr:CoA ester lyase [Elioraea sp. Yellowstone]TQF82473.1 CoA ester lyase [Elioraea sp. Yellowstone]
MIPRSFLFVPADSDRKLARGPESGASALILDLEDSVAPDRKPVARAMAAAWLRARDPTPKAWVRVNALDTGLAMVDLAAVVGARPDGIVLPKCQGAADLARIDAALSALEAREGLPDRAIPVMPLVTETPAAMFTLGAYAGAPRLAAITWGGEDLAAALGARSNRLADGTWDEPYRLARALTLFAAGAAGVPAIDTVYADARDLEGLRAECEAARRMGFVGRMAIHPAQVAVIEAAFAPTEQERAWAARVVAAFEAQPGAGVIALDGRMVDRPHLVQAKRILGTG